jgi:site-specific recombinase XerD
MNTDLLKPIPTDNIEFWTPPRLRAFELIAPYLGTRIVTETELELMERALREGERYLPRHKKLRLALVLEELCNGGVLDSAVRPEVPIRVPRPLILPASHESFRLLSSFQTMQNYLWQEWFARDLTSEELYLAFVVILGIEMGPAGANWHRLLSQLSWKDINPKGAIDFRIHWLDRSGRRHPITLTPGAILLIEKIRDSSAATTDEDYVFMPLVFGVKRRAQAFAKSLSVHYRRLLDQLRQRYPKENFPSWHHFNDSAPLIALFEGIEHPCVLTALKQRTLATSVPVHSGLPLLVGEAGPPADFIRHVVKEKVERIRNPHTWKSVPVKASPDSDDTTDSDWCGEALQLLRQLLAEIQSKFTKRATAKRAEELRPLFAAYRERASRLAPATSALHLGIDWAEHKFATERRLKPRSLAKYLRIAIEEGFLDHTESMDLATWQREEHEQLISRLLEVRRAPATTKTMLIVLRQLYEFATEHGYCSEPPNVPYSLQWVGGSGRPAIVGLSQFDAFTRVLLEESCRESRMLSIAAMLGYDGGLRADEVVTLTLGDVMAADGELWVWIWSGKSLAARRAIPLHLLAPEEHVRAISAWVLDRRSEFREDAHVHTIGLFGPEKSRERYDYDSLIGVLLERLKDAFGDGVDFHTLRHSFASFIFLRWYAARHEDFAETLFEGNHELFQAEAMVRLARFFTVGCYDRVPDYSPSDLVMMAKLMGHNGLETYFASYVHTLHAVQHFIAKSLGRRFGARELPGETIARLVPGMRNRKTRAKLPSRTISYLAERRMRRSLG